MRVFYKPYKKNRKHIIAESNTGNVLDTFRKIFSQAVVDSTEMTFEYDSNNLFIIFDTFNDHFFNGRLKRIQFSLCSKDDFVEILKLMNKDYDTDYYAAYIPQYTTSQNQTRKETIFIIDSYGKMTFKFAISCMLHEMIHYYDMHYG